MPPTALARLAPTSVSTSSDDTTLEAHKQLHGEARGKTGRLPADLIASHVLEVAGETDFDVQTAALEALLRRIKSAKAADGWRLVSATRGKSPFGSFTLLTGEARRYRLFLSSLRPLRGSCECPDYARNSLGLCKHLLWLMERVVKAAKGLPAGTALLPELIWNPIRPFTGEGDWLERVLWTSAEPPPGGIRFFDTRKTPAPLRAGVASKAADRLALCRALLAFVEGACKKKAAVDPALAPLLRRELGLLEHQLEVAPAWREVTKALARLKRPLFPYQLEGVRRFLTQGRFLLADDMGLGKTTQAIAACHALFETKAVERGLLIVPAALKVQWQREWSMVSDVPVAIVEGPADERARLYRSTKRGFLIANYEQVLKDLAHMHHFAPGAVVLDEAQRIKNWAAKTSAYVKQLQAPWRLVLTGTPMENRLGELASLMEWVDDLALEPKWRLTEWHAVRADGTREVVGARNLDTLRMRIEKSSLRRLRKEVIAQLPKRTDTTVPVPMTAEQAGAHSEFDQPIAVLMRKARTRPLTQPEFLKLMSMLTQQRIICNGLAQRNFEEIWPGLEGTKPTESTLAGLFMPKLQELRELIESLVVVQGRKVVVFSQWKRMLRLAEWALSDILGTSGLRAVYFTGDESQARRTRNIVDFHDDDATRVFLSTDAGGVGLNLQRAASACVHLDLPWNPAVYEQRSARIHRLGQKAPVDVYALVTSTGIEARIASIVKNKQALFSGLFDGKSDEVQFEGGGGFLKGIEVLLEPVVVPKLPEVLAPEEEDEAAVVPDALTSDAAPPVPELPASAPPRVAPAVEPSGSSPFAGVKLERKPDGRLILEAEPGSANQLAALFEGFAGLLRQAGATTQAER